MSTKKEIFRGSLVALVTPMKGGEVDFDAMERLVDWHLEEGTDGLVVTGTTGEVSTLSTEEDRRLWRTVTERVNGRIPVVAGAGSNNTHHAVEWSRAAAEIGVDGLLHVTPYYNKPTQAGLAAHYRAIADATDLPVCLYSVPGRTAVAIAAETVAELSTHPHVAALKEAGGSVDRVSEVRNLCDLPILSGDDALTLPMMAVGAVGAISVTGNVVPGDNARMIHAALDGDFARALKIHQRLYPLARALFLESNPIPAKAALAMMGRIEDELRLPLVPMSANARETLAGVMRELGLV